MCWGLPPACSPAFLTSTFLRRGLAAFCPAIRVVLATPVASFIILSLLWIGHTRVPAFISMLIVIPIVWANLCTAVRETDRDLLEMARLFRMKKSRVLRLIYIPAAMPSFRAACLTALGLAWKSGIAAEVLCLPKTAVGTQLYYSKIYLETPALFAWTIVVTCSVSCWKRGSRACSRSPPGRGRRGGMPIAEREIELRGVSLTLDGKAVLSGLNLRLRPAA